MAVIVPPSSGLGRPVWRPRRDVTRFATPAVAAAFPVDLERPRYSPRDWLSGVGRRRGRAFNWRRL